MTVDLVDVVVITDGTIRFADPLPGLGGGLAVMMRWSKRGREPPDRQLL
jgi:hypothetical protein